jgi:hypothetical protein
MIHYTGEMTMNIFALHTDPVLSAQSHCDKHVVKMIIEYAQLMSTAHRVFDGSLYQGKTKNGRNIKRWLMPDEVLEEVVYKASHVNHPSGIWCRQTKANYDYLYTLWLSLCKEYTHRYGRIHLTQSKLEDILCNAPSNIPHGTLTELPQAMPDDAKMPNVIDAYRNYYRVYKKDFAKWTKRQTPEWF